MEVVHQISNSLRSIEMLELLAVLGSLAWFAPIVVPWIMKKIVKPKLIIISHKVIEVGYTTFGPIVNINMSFLSENKEALIKTIKIKLQHENSETHEFEWEWFEESLGEMDLGNTGIFPYKKNQKAIALRIIENDIIERKIGFQNSEFSLKYQDLVNKTNEIFNRLIKAGNGLGSIKEVESYININDHIKNSFFWNIGKYSMVVEVHLLKRGETFIHNISFQLTNYDKKRLEANIDSCTSFIENNYIIQDPDFSATWNWVYTMDLSQ